MTSIRKRGEQIRAFILENVENNPTKAVAFTMEKFHISRQAVHRHIRLLVDQGTLIRPGMGHYALCPQEEWHTTLSVADNPYEDVVWRNEIRERLGHLPDNTISIWQYGFTEMFNNVIDHSESASVYLQVVKTAYSTEMIIRDNGVGIFNKITKAMSLIDERHAVIELTKGKLTTDPERHTGEGIFFTSRMFDAFGILSGEVFLAHTYGDEEDWILQNQERSVGTLISIKLKNNTARTLKQIFDRFTSDNNYGFTKTVVPVRMAQYGDEKLVSRSQAKRLLERIDRFKTVLFDFKEIEIIGQAFADEVFRVFANQHPHIELIPINASDIVMKTINNARHSNIDQS
ncbi:MAG: ArsR family transcriptional regulator [Syntrophus sp. (in: bacteria)]|nr:ArsR family transcriptional regulator [Syntrophus sp. (in: bacteria)]